MLLFVILYLVLGAITFGALAAFCRAYEEEINGDGGEYVLCIIAGIFWPPVLVGLIVGIPTYWLVSKLLTLNKSK